MFNILYYFTACNVSVAILNDDYTEMFEHITEMCVAHAFTSRHRGAEGEHGPGMEVAAAVAWVVVAVVGAAQGDHLTQMTAATSVEKGVTMHTTVPEGVVVDEGDVAGAGMFIAVWYTVQLHPLFNNNVVFTNLLIVITATNVC